MVKDNDEGWVFPRRKPITKDVLERAITAEEEAARREHRRVAPGHQTIRSTAGRADNISGQSGSLSAQRAFGRAAAFEAEDAGAARLAVAACNHRLMLR
jgi:hypothetical protein